MEFEHSFNLAYKIFQSIPSIWTFFLLMLRFTGLLMLLPGIGGGAIGMLVRAPAIVVLSFASLLASKTAPFPADWGILITQCSSEYLFGIAMGMIPLAMVCGAQMAGFLSGSTMGLGAANLIDPTLGQSTSDIGRIFGDMTIMLFLFMGGHYVVIHEVAGFSSQITPGAFNVNDLSIDLLFNRVGEIFRVGVMISSPVLVALLLTQFVMGLVTKAVPSVNVFVVSFPLTIGIGLVLTMLSLPEVFHFLEREFEGVDTSLQGLAESAIVSQK